MAALPLQNLISQSTTLQYEYRVKSYDLGDGVSYAIQDGLNATRWYGSIVYTMLSQTDFQTVKTFLDGLGGAATFDYQPIAGDSTTYKFRVSDKLQIADAGGGRISLTIPVRQEWV
jgi:phage-related protein